MGVVWEALSSKSTKSDKELMFTFQGMISRLVLVVIVSSSFQIGIYAHGYVCLCCLRFSKTRKPEAATFLSA